MILKFYKVGGTKKDIPAPSLNPWYVYLAVLIDSIYYVGMDETKFNPWSGTLIDDLNLPTFDESLDIVRSLSDSDLTSRYNQLLKIPATYAILTDDLDKSVRELTSYRRLFFPLAFFNDLITVRQAAIVTIFAYSVFFGFDPTRAIDWDELSPNNSALMHLHNIGKDINLLPFLSYQSLWREYYRNGWVDDTEYGDNGLESFGLVPYLPTEVDVFDLFPYFDPLEESGISVFDIEGTNPLSDVDFWAKSDGLAGIGHYPDTTHQLQLDRIHYVFGKHDVNFVNDYFTSASINSEGENKVSIPLTSSLFATNTHETQAVGISAPPGGGVPFVGSTGAIRGQVSVLNSGSIPDLRLANILQILEEKSALASGNRPYEFYKLIFGHIIPDSRLHRPTFLGRIKKYVSIQEVTQTGMSSEGQPLGDVAGKASSVSSDGLFSVKVDEPSWIQVIMSVVPDQAYFQGFPIELVKTDPYDFLIPDLQHVGMRSIDSSELFCGVGSSESELDASFGFTDIYNEYRCSNNEVHGEFRSSMAYWTSIRRFASMPRLNKDFIRVNSTDKELYKPFAVTSGYTSHIIGQLWFNYSHVRPLDIYPSYSL